MRRTTHWRLLRKRSLKKKQIKSQLESQDMHTSKTFGVYQTTCQIVHSEKMIDSISSHIAAMKAEKQNMSLIRELMDITFADRRAAIVNQQWKVSTIKEEYPCLFDDEEVKYLNYKVNLSFSLFVLNFSVCFQLGVYSKNRQKSPVT